jgi:hypothetical protein
VVSNLAQDPVVGCGQDAAADSMGQAADSRGQHRVILWKTSHSASEGDATMAAPSSIDPARSLHDHGVRVAGSVRGERVAQV